MCSRLKELLDILDITPEELAKTFGVNRSSIYRYAGINRKEPREIPVSLALKICDKYGLSMDWLTGRPDASMYRDNTTNALVEIFNGLSDDNKKELFSYAMYLRGKERKDE